MEAPVTLAKAVDLDAVLAESPERRLQSLTRIARAVHAGENGIFGKTDKARLAEALTALVEEGVGGARERVEMGELLGWLGDPRLRTPDQEDYWATVRSKELGYALEIGVFPVTNTEFQAFVAAGGYDDAANWSDEGWAWRQSCEDPWPVRAKAEGSGPYIVPNQPVVGVTWFEAEAYAKWAGARLPRFDEHMWVTRGDERRPYPWGSPFGDGNANTQEEVLLRPVAVGLYLNDVTPDGVRDLAGNVAEWAQDGVGSQKWTHPGAFDQPSMAAWAKARSVEPADARFPSLGFRLARD